ncbi:MAG TPA: cytochrome P460 family protein, partial [Candidatus Binatia bacterium]|nr:cytochrome P460 family protein [Candidatus Binatia bacterium]
NPCAAKNPCAAQNPCAAKNPCAARNPCAAGAAGAVQDEAAEAAFKAYKRWKKVNSEPVKSATHGNTLVFTYLNKTAEGPAMKGTFPFPPGAVLVKEAFEDQGGRPGARGSVFVMEKRKKGYDAANADWHYAVVAPDGGIAMTGSGKAGSPTQFCAACHQAAKANDYVFGTGTTMKVKPVQLGQAPQNPCAARNPCAAKNPCAARNPCAAKNPCAGRK